jgi:hypothetical protein
MHNEKLVFLNQMKQTIFDYGVLIEYQPTPSLKKK